MQVGLIQRYLGNKSSIASDIIECISCFADPGDHVMDGFSGSLAVSAQLRAAGYVVSCNDINHFSWAFAQAFFSGDEPYAPNGTPLDFESWGRSWSALAEELIAPYGAEIPKGERHSYIFDTYCEEGRQSAFKSARGSTGRRRFFSSENGRAVDRALSRIRFWWRSGQIDERTRCILSAMLASAVEKVSNTQGTYHDFPRELVDSRSLSPIRIMSPPSELFIGKKAECIGKCEDTLEFIKRVPRHKVLYLDPPYNFRQYTSYYFMLNLITRFSEITDLEAYFAKVQFVRGQNMGDDFSSTFCSSKNFLPSLKRLVERADAEYVVLSYFDGRNHWGEFKSSESEERGAAFLEKFLTSELFESGSFRSIPVGRMNYQSYGGFKSKAVREFIFSAKKSSVSKKLPGRGRNWTGTVLA